MKRKGRLWCGLCICLIGAAFCGMQLYQELKPRIESEQQYRLIRDLAFETGVSKQKGEGEIPDFTVLEEINQDVKGWVRIPDTTIDYPVVQGEDNDYYLNHTFERRKSIVGSIFMDSKNQLNFQDDVTILYGHHIKGGKMFSPLSGYKKQSFYDTHTTGHLYSQNQNWEVEWFAGQIIDGQTSFFTQNFPDAATKKAWLEYVKVASVFNSDVMPSVEDRILALCTCTYEYGDARFVLYGRLKEATGK